MRQNDRVSFDRKRVLRDSLSVAIPVGSYGVAFGAASVSAGFSVAQSSVLSLFLFSGASQFAVVGVMGAGGGVLSAVLTATLLGLRNMFYGFRNAPLLKVRGIKRIASAQLTIDESTGVSLMQEERGEDAMRYGFYATGIGVFILWNLFTLLGAIGAQSIGDPAALGLDAAVPAAFLGLVWPRLTDLWKKCAAVLAIVVALILTPLLSAGLPIIVTVLIAIAFGWNEAKKATP
jgi:predicted branched-subunit amino acid permease